MNNMAVLPRCNLMICHGGNGTIYQALFFGLPVLAHTSIFEQEWNVQQLEALGLGASINDCSSAEQLLSTITKWIEIKPQKNFSARIAGFRESRGHMFHTAVKHLITDS